MISRADERPSGAMIVFLASSNRGSGGLIVVCQHAKMLATKGYQVTIAFEYFDPNYAMPDFEEPIEITTLAALAYTRAKYSLAIATWWETVFNLFKIDADSYGYIVQSDERKFYSVQDVNRIAACRLTYSLPGVNYIAIAGWLVSMLRSEFNQTQVSYAPNGINLDMFRPYGESIAERMPLRRVRVLIEGPGAIAFKRVGFAFDVCSEVKKTRDIEIWYVASDGVCQEDWKADRCFNKVEFAEMPKIFRSCDILVKFSTVEGFYGPPLEMMASGGVVLTSNVSGHEEYIENEKNSLVVEMDDFDGAVKALQRLVDEPQTRAKLVAGGLLTAQQFAWSRQSIWFEEAIVRAMQNKIGLNVKRVVTNSLQVELSKYRPEKEREFSFVRHIKERIKRYPSCYWLFVRIGLAAKFIFRGYIGRLIS